MKEKERAYLQDKNLDNAFRNLTGYIHFLMNTLFVILCVILFSGALTILLGFLHSDYDLLCIGILVFLISAVVYFFIIKPLFLIMYALSKILINTEKHT